MEVKISFGRDDRNNPNESSEILVLKEWCDILEKRYNHKFNILTNSTDYTTLQPDNCLDLLRLKYGGSKWIKIFITNELHKTLVDDPRFAVETKKNQSYWKSTLTDTDISKYYDVLDAAFEWLMKYQIKNE